MSLVWRVTKNLESSLWNLHRGFTDVGGLDLVINMSAINFKILSYLNSETFGYKRIIQETINQMMSMTYIINRISTYIKENKEYMEGG